MPTDPIPISVLLLTKNEEHDLPDCLESVSWSNDVHVFDSISTDRTIEIATNAGATVTERAFDNYAAQRNAALQAAFKHDWVLILDADERVPPGLRDEMARFVETAGPGISAARMRRRDFFMDRWLKHAQISPFYIRLVRPVQVRYEREINEVLRTDGTVVDLKEPFDHFPFSKGMEVWLARHDRYSTMEAQQVIRAREGGGSFSIWKAFFAKDFNVRRFNQKEIFYRMPARPLIKWLYMMLGRGAWLDGKPGRRYVALQVMYERMIVRKTREMDAASRAQSA